ncbi:MAG: nuclease-related domain-containing protein, partial [Ignavibacteria bacterium]
NDLKVNSAQIDHVVVGPGGIYTVETKNYYGQIYGNATNKEWSQVYKDDKGYFRKRPFYNPVKQGIVHSIALNKFISEKKAGDFFIKTIVVFTDPDTNLKVHSPKIPVIHTHEILQTINSTLTSLTTEQVNNVVETLLPITKTKS